MQAQTTSAPRTASSNESTALPPTSWASSSARSGLRPAMRISSKSRTRVAASTCERAWTPDPSTARTLASGRARAFVETAEEAPVRTAVISVPSMRASGCPVWSSKSEIVAWCDGRSRFSAKTDTSFVSRIPSAYPGIAARSPRSVLAAIRGGTDVRPALSSTNTRSSASSRRSRSSSSRTSARLRTSTARGARARPARRWAPGRCSCRS